MSKKPKRKSYIMFVLENTLADVRHFFRHGLKGRARGAKKYSGYLGHQWVDWWKTRRNRKKFAKIERKQQAGRLKQEALFEAKDAAGSFIALLRSPVDFMKWARWKFKELRKMSFKEAMAEIWMGYRALIAGLLNRIAFAAQRIGQFPLWLRAITILVLVGGVVTVAASPWLISFAKQKRSEVMLTDAKDLDAEGRIVEAYQKGRAAALLQRENDDARSFVLELAEEVRSPEAVWWAEQVAKDSDYSEESVEKVIELATKFRQLKTATQYLGILKDDYPDAPAITDAELRILAMKGQRIEAISRAREAYQNGGDSKIMHQILSEFLLTSNDPVARNELAQYLPKHLFRDDEVGLTVMRVVLTNADFLQSETSEQIDFARLLQVMQAQPDAKEHDRALAFGRAYQAGAIGADAAAEGIIAQYDLDKPEDRQTLIELAKGFQLYAMIDRLPVAGVKDFAWLRLEGYLLSDSPDIDAAQQMVTDAKASGLSPMQAAWGQVLISLKRGDNKLYNQQMQTALDFADITMWPDLERTVHRLGSQQQILEFYYESLRRSPDSPWIASRALGYAYRMGADKELLAMSEQLPLSTFERDPFNQLFLIYLKALHGRDLAGCRFYGEELVSRHPREPAYYLGLAFVYAQSGNSDVAESVIATFPMGVDFDTLPPFLRMSLAGAGKENALEGAKLPLAKERELANKLAPGA